MEMCLENTATDLSPSKGGNQVRQDIPPSPSSVTVEATGLVNLEDWCTQVELRFSHELSPQLMEAFKNGERLTVTFSCIPKHNGS